MATCPFGPSKLCHTFRHSGGEQHVGAELTLEPVTLDLRWFEKGIFSGELAQSTSLNSTDETISMRVAVTRGSGKIVVHPGHRSYDY